MWNVEWGIGREWVGRIVSATFYFKIIWPVIGGAGSDPDSIWYVDAIS